MPLTRHSRIREVWRNPVGHDMLVNLLRQLGRDESWAESPLNAGQRLSSLDRLAGAGFADLVVEMASGEVDGPPPAQPTPQSWWREAVIYQIYLPSFMDSDHDGVGDLLGVVQRLPYLASLGVDTLLLWPLLDAADSTGRAVLDHFAPNPDYGALEDFEHLTAQAHERGMRVLVGLDLVATAEQHPWFREALKSGGKEALYILRPGGPDSPPNNWGRTPADTFWRWHPELSAWGLGVFGRGYVDLNWDSPEVRKRMAQVLHFWGEKGADGFWLGSVNMISKGGFDDGNPALGLLAGYTGYERMVYGPRLHRYLRELRAAADLPKDALLMGEVRGVGAGMARQITGDGRGELDMVTDADHLRVRFPVRAEDARLELAELKRYYLRWMEQYGAERWMTLFLENAETPRMVSRLGANPLYRPILAKMLATLLLTLRGTPILYQGEELGLANVRFSSVEELRDAAAVRLYRDLCEGCGEQVAFQRAASHAADHARVPMPWSAGPRAGFTGAEPWMRLNEAAEYLNAAAQMEDKNSVWRFTSRLIALRKKSACLVYGSFNPVFAKNKRVFCYFRILEGEKWYVEVNLTERGIPHPGRILRTMKLAHSNYDVPARTLRPYEANLYRCE